MENNKENCRSAAPTESAPTGWHCTRAPGHEGPCAAVPTEVCADDYTPEQMVIYQHGVEDGKLIARGMARFNAGRAAAPVSGVERFVSVADDEGFRLALCKYNVGEMTENDFIKFLDGHVKEAQRAAVSASQAAPTALEGWSSGAVPEGSAFYAYHPSLVHADFNPWGVVEAVFDGEKIVGAVWNGEQDCWDTLPIKVELWRYISGPHLFTPTAAPVASQAAPVGGDLFAAFKAAYLSWNGFHTENELAHAWGRGTLAGEMFRAGAAVAAAKVPTGEHEIYANWKSGCISAQEAMLSLGVLFGSAHIAAPVEQGKEYKTKATNDVLTERQRQIEQERFDSKHDDTYKDNELIKAAVCYALNTKSTHYPPAFWPWPMDWWKPKDKYTNLKKAVALLLAEMDRLNRLPK